MKKRTYLLIGAALAALALAALLSCDGRSGRSYRFVEVARGDLESVVSSTGTLDAVKTVEVGTQVSGIVSEILADFNEPVREGQVVARLDTVPLSLAVAEARANLKQAQARLRYSRENFERADGLFAEGVVADSELNGARYDYESAEAGVEASRIKLDIALRNLAYATVTAPIDGIVIERDVDVGQTVAASLSAPRLFLIAGDLSRMQILASVDESDIGGIVEGQKVRFTVQAWPDDEFEGRVRQVRLQSTQSENVVTYIVVVDVDNAGLRLLPGMTATMDFIAETATNALLVPNAALRFRPDDSMLAELRSRREQRRDEKGGERGARGEGLAPSSGAPGAAASGEPPSDFALLYFLDENGRLDAAPVRKGLSDGSKTVIEGRRIQEGMRVIAGISASDETESAANPFQSGDNSGHRPPPGPGF